MELLIGEVLEKTKNYLCDKRYELTLDIIKAINSTLELKEKLENFKDEWTEKFRPQLDESFKLEKD
ncbi:MAG: hypothetical protein NZ853_06540 [Leptospiraceae bacterium]|nr:hypothetical protein [Leptospiraceae bacterium]